MRREVWAHPWLSPLPGHVAGRLALVPPRFLPGVPIGSEHNDLLAKTRDLGVLLVDDPAAVGAVLSGWHGEDYTGGYLRPGGFSGRGMLSRAFCSP